MPLLFEFIIKQSICLAIIYLFYWVVLRRLTFYNRNRWYLLGYSILSFLIPFINISSFLQQNEWSDNKLLNIIPVFENYTSDNTAVAPAVRGGWDGWDLLFCLLLTGIGLMLVRLFIQLLSLRKMKKASCLVSENKVRVYQVNKPIIPFSFGNSIFINQELHNEDELKKVISHEFVHVRQKHSLDILWAELLCILNWFNPFAWFIRTAIRQNLEFIADSKVLDEGVDKQQYQYLLLKVIGNNHFSIANQFNFSSLKKRIAMMNKMKTAKVQLIKFLFVLPVIAVLLLAFRERFSNKIIEKPLTLSSETVKQLIQAAGVRDQSANGEKTNFVIDTVPEEVRIKAEQALSYFPSSYSLYKDDEMTSEQRTFFERNPKVNLLHWKKLRIEVYLSNGNVEEYILGNNDGKFEKKYGKLPHPGGSIPYMHSANEAITVIGYPISPATVVAGEPLTTSEAGTTVTGYSLVPTTAISGTALTTTNAIAPTMSTINAENIPGTISVNGTLAIASTAPALTLDAIEPGEKIMELKVYKKTKKEDLDKLVAEAKTKGVVLEFKDPGYNDKGEIRSLSGTMKKDDSKNSFSVSDFEVVRLIMYKTGEHYSLKVTCGKKEVI